MAGETSEATGKDDVTGDTSGKVADELGKDVGETGVGKEAGEGPCKVGEENRIAGEFEEVGEPGKKEAGEAAGELSEASKVTGELCKRVEVVGDQCEVGEVTGELCGGPLWRSSMLWRGGAF